MCGGRIEALREGPYLTLTSWHSRWTPHSARRATAPTTALLDPPNRKEFSYTPHSLDRLLPPSPRPPPTRTGRAQSGGRCARTLPLLRHLRPTGPIRTQFARRKRPANVTPKATNSTLSSPGTGRSSLKCAKARPLHPAARVSPKRRTGRRWRGTRRVYELSRSAARRPASESSGPPTPPHSSACALRHRGLNPYPVCSRFEVLRLGSPVASRINQNITAEAGTPYLAAASSTTDPGGVQSSPMCRLTQRAAARARESRLSTGADDSAAVTLQSAA